MAYGVIGNDQGESEHEGCDKEGIRPEDPRGLDSEVHCSTAPGAANLRQNLSLFPTAEWTDSDLDYAGENDIDDGPGGRCYPEARN